MGPKAKKKGKDDKAKKMDTKANVEQPGEKEEAEKVEKIRTITISVESLSQMVTQYTLADIKVEIRHMDELIGCSDVLPLAMEEDLPIGYSVQFMLDAFNGNDLNNILSNPIMFTVYQMAGQYNMEMYPPKVESATETQLEEILGVYIMEEQEEKATKKKGGKGKGGKKSPDSKSKKGKGSKTSSKTSKKSSEKGSKGSKTSKGGGKSKSSDKSPGKEKGKKKDKDKDGSEFQIIGHCTMDLSPFLLGRPCIKSNLPVHQPEIYNDERLVAYGNLPRLSVNATVDEPFCFEEVDRSNILKFTVESIYNLPDEFHDGLSYKIATYLPLTQPVLEPVYFDKGNYTTEYNDKPFKKYYNLLEIANNSSLTPEIIEKSIDRVHNRLGVDLMEQFNEPLEDDEPRPRVEYNTMKKVWLSRESTNVVKYKLIRNRRWPLEFFIEPDPTKKGGKPGKGGKGSKATLKGSKGSKTSKTSKGSKASSKSSGSEGKKGKGKKKASINTPLHLMSFVNVAKLLYPGVRKARVVADLRTYTEHEMKQETGTDDSIFIPKAVSTAGDKGKKGKDGKGSPKGKDASGKGSKQKSTKGSKEKDSKGSKGKKGKKGKGEKEVEVLPPEPSEQITNSEGKPTFIVVEMEFLNPLYKAKKIEDLSGEIMYLLPKREPVPTYIMNKELAKASLDDCIKSLITSIYKEYQKYSNSFKEKKLQFFQTDSFSFNDHLQANGKYQEYLTTLVQVIVTYVNEHYDIESARKTHKQFENFVSTLYVHLVSNMNRILNGPISCGLDFKPVEPVDDLITYAFMAREAEELNAFLLAERYHQQEIIKHAQNPDIWLNFAIFQLAYRNMDFSLECIKECLALNISHKYGLLMYAIMLFFRKEYYYSETTFLTLVNYYPRYMEGWVCLYVFYLAMEHHAGVDICEEKIELLARCEDEPETDFIVQSDDVAWTTEICPKGNHFFKTAMILLKLRCVNYAEMCLGFVPFPENGELKYYSAVIRYLKHDYEEALIYLKTARKEHGPDYAVTSLIGHCYFQLKDYDRAKDAYMFIMLSYNRPDDMHLVYLNLALIYEKENDNESTKKYMLHVCKYNPTAYDWLLLGICYFRSDYRATVSSGSTVVMLIVGVFQEESWTYAEECFTEANLRDCYIAETWAYLSLTNLKIGKPWIAQQCYRQMLKRDLQNDFLYDLVESEFTKNKLN